MTEHKKSEKTEAPSKKEEISIPKRNTSPKKTVLAQRYSTDLWQEFDNTFARFRNDFEDLLFPTVWTEKFIIPQVRVPVIDLEDNEKEYVVTAEMPGFKKEDIEIQGRDNFLSITGYAGWKYDEKCKLYICKERACETFYREIGLPEEIKLDEVTANLTEGVLQIVLPKRAPKPKRKILVK